MTTIRACLLIALTLAPGVAGADAVSRIKGFGKLSAGDKKTARAALGRIACYHGCTEILTRCLAAKSPHRTARRVSRYVVFLAGKGLNPEQIAKVITLRKESVHPARRHKIKVDGAPRRGDAAAPVVVVEYADFQCPHCARVSPKLLRAVASFKGKAVLYFKPYPLRFSGARLLAARATLAAHRQGKAWEMIHGLFEDPAFHTEEGAERLAAKLGLKLDRFRAAMKDMNILKQIERNKIEGLRLGIAGTPAIYVNGKRYRLRKDEMHFKDRIAEELELTGK